MFDLLLIAALSLCTLGLVVNRLITQGSYKWVIVATVFMCGIQIAFEGPRIQLLLAYATTAMFALSALIGVVSNRIRPPSTTQLRSSIFSRIARWFAAGVTVVAILATIVLCLVFPRYEFPKPSGQYALGVHELRLIDNSRLDLNTRASNDRRQLLVRVTYPASAISAAKRYSVSMVPNTGLAGALMRLSLPDSLTPLAISLGQVATHARLEAPLASTPQPIPVLIFTHGHGGIAEQNTVLIEELASHGYVVLSINHPFVSGFFQYADGLIARPIMGKKMQSIVFAPDQIAQLQLLGLQFSQATSFANQAPLMKKIDELNPKGKRITAEITQLTSDDQRFVIDSLASLQTSDPILAGHLDLQRVGVFGMSMGGSASVITCSLDSRCRAGINMDGWTRSLDPLPPLKVPFMHMSNEHHFTSLIPYGQSHAASYDLRVSGANHVNYTDVSLAAPQLKHIGLLGPIDGTRMLQLTNDYVLAFFNKHLVGKSEPLLDSPSDRYPEVSFQSK